MWIKTLNKIYGLIVKILDSSIIKLFNYLAKFK